MNYVLKYGFCPFLCYVLRNITEKQIIRCVITKAQLTRKHSFIHMNLGLHTSFVCLCSTMLCTSPIISVRIRVAAGVVQWDLADKVSNAQIAMKFAK